MEDNRFLPVGKLILALEWCCDLSGGEMIEVPEYNHNKLHLGVISHFQMNMIGSLVNLIMGMAGMHVIVYPLMVNFQARLYTKQHPEVL
jgi:hypothetical protein